MTDTPVAMPTRLSPSSVTTFLQCQLKYKLSRIDKIVEPPSDAQVLGNVTHEALEGVFALPAGERTLPAARRIMIAQWHDKWQRVCAEELRLTAHGQHVLRWNAWSCVENYFALEDPNTVTLRVSLCGANTLKPSRMSARAPLISRHSSLSRLLRAISRRLTMLRSMARRWG